ncbi:MAG: ABC transporter ATP-binding protein [Candidatus Omnitrophota bacterium]
MLTAKDVKKIYRTGAKEVRAVDGISLEIRKGESVAIVGPSGSGKSTLLHILGGLDRPTSGKIFLEDSDLYAMSDSKRADIRGGKVGFVFQAYHLLPEFTALENVMLPALIKRTEKRGRRTEIREKAKKILESVGLEDRLSHRPGELSGGESQRVAIARALINDPQVLLCDEPTGNLDSKNSEAIYSLLFELKTKSGISLVVVTHDESITRQTNRTIRLKDGKEV